MKIRTPSRVGLVMAALVAMTACATAPGTTQSLVYMVAIQQGTSRFIEHKETAPERSTRANEVIRVIGVLRSAAGDQDATVDELQARALALIDAAGIREPSDRALANTLVAAVAESLHAKVTDGVLDPAARVRVETVLDQIAAAARVYVSDLSAS